MHSRPGGDGMPLFRFASPCRRGSHGKNSHPGAATLPGASPASDRVRWQDLRRGRCTIIGENRESRAGSSSRDRLAGGTQGLAASAAVPVACRAAAAEARTSTVARTSPGHGLLLAPGTMLPWRGDPDYSGGSRFRNHGFASRHRQPSFARVKPVTLLLSARIWPRSVFCSSDGLLLRGDRASAAVTAENLHSGPAPRFHFEPLTSKKRERY